MIGTTISQYEILEKLGSGGMGVVYTARDTKLDRTVALKFLPPGLVRDEQAKERFIQEAKAASALNHSNICAIHDIRETDDGQLFIVMARYDGQTLKHYLQNGPLEQSEAIRIVRQIAEGLSAAHDKGIVHRDIKPANIMITEKGRAVILDFGLAKLAGGVDLTKTGSTIGTTAYMSPEQARGDTVDQQTDIWSLGAVLYEMVAGRKPFPGEYDQAVIYGILNSEPESLDPSPRPHGSADASSEHSVKLQRVILKALAKDPGQRYPSAAAMIADLDAIETGGAVVRPTRRLNRNLVYASLAAVAVLIAIASTILIPNSRKAIDSVAVLPLVNLSGDSEQEFLADGMTDALINELSKIGALKVISRQSVMQFKDSDLSLPEIAADLDVDAIVSGSVIKSGDNIRVSAQLTAAEAEENLWAASFDEHFENVLVLHSELAQVIAREIQVSVTPEEEALLTAVRVVNPEAYEAYLRGHHHLYKLSRGDAETARDYFEQSLSIDSTYAEAYVGLAGVWAILQQMGAASPAEAGPGMLGALDRAFAIDSTLADVHYMQALASMVVQWDWPGAETGFLRTLELNPNHAEAHAYFAHLLYILRRQDEGRIHAERAIELDPHNALFRSIYGITLTFEDRFDEAIEQFRLSQETAPNSFLNFAGLHVSYLAKGQFEDALAVSIKRHRLAGDQEMLESLENGYVEGGYRKAMWRAAETLAKRAETEFVAPGRIAALYLNASDIDAAVEWFERGFVTRDPNLPYIGVAPAFRVARGHPGYEELLRKMKLEMWIQRPGS